MNNEDEEGRVRCKSTVKNETKTARWIYEKRISQQDDDAHTRPSSTDGAGEDPARDDAQSVQQLV